MGTLVQQNPLESEHNRRPGVFIVSEFNGALSREVGTLKAGESVLDGTPLARDGDYIVAFAEGHVEVDFVGFAIGAWDATATGTNADIPGVPYLARFAEVNEDELSL